MAYKGFTCCVGFFCRHLFYRARAQGAWEGVAAFHCCRGGGGSGLDLLLADFYAA